MTNEELNVLECEILKMLEFELYIDAETYTTYVRKLRTNFAAVSPGVVFVARRSFRPRGRYL